MTILERVYEELGKQNIKPIRLCEHIGIPTGLLSTWKRRNTEPKAKYIKPMAEFLGVSENYLLTGEKEGEQNLNDDPDIRKIERARRDMPTQEKEKMMKILEASFEEYFKE